jgi:HD-GYP domain-containing protein (c-di-GMP phosphodiesterase class II)
MMDSDFHSIRVSTLRGDIKIPFDVYVRIAGKYIHYCRAGESFEGKRLENLRAKKLKKMFIKPDDVIPYDQYLEQSIDAAYDTKSTKTLDVRAEVIQGFQQAAAEEFMENPTSESAYHHISSYAQRFVEFLEKKPLAALPLLKIENIDCSITHHSVNVATLSILMASKSKFKESGKLHLLALGCMLHDIDHFTSNADLTRPLSALSRDELAFYREHPKRGANHMQGVTFVDQIVTNVITQHEECFDGTGYPKGLMGSQIEPVVFLAATANSYDRLVGFQKMTPKEAAKIMMLEKLGQLPLEHLQTLSGILKNLNLI